MTTHAERERETDRITRQELEEALLFEDCDLLEDYPNDPRGHSRLILGFTQAGLQVRIQEGIDSPGAGGVAEDGEAEGAPQALGEAEVGRGP